MLIPVSLKCPHSYYSHPPIMGGLADVVNPVPPTVFFKVVVTVFSYSKLPSLLLAQAYPGSRILP